MSKLNFITEEDLIFLGFKKFVEDGEGWDKPFYYYTHKIKGLSLITNANDECVKGRWWVEISEYPEVGKFRDVTKLWEFMKVIKSLRQ